VTLAQLNALDEARFVALLGGVFEHSPWVAQQAWQQRPFDSVEGLFRCMRDAVGDADANRQVALILAHPELAGREATQGQLSADSSSEQARLGLLNLERADFERIAALNREYRQRFGFPCIVALRLHASRAGVLDEIQRRLGNEVQAELANAMEQIGHIAHGRLEKLMTEN